MATHSSVLAWRIPGTGEPDGLPSLGSHRVGHDLTDLAAVTGSKSAEDGHCSINYNSWKIVNNPITPQGFPDSSVDKESTCNGGDPGWIPGWGRSVGGEGRLLTPVFLGFPCGLAGKETTCNAGDLHLIPRLGRSPGKGKGYLLQYSGLENSTDCIVHGVAKSRT